MNSLDHLLASVVAGNLSRREFMARAAALGIGATALAQITTALDVHAERLASGLNTLTLNAVQVFGNFDPAIGTDYTQNMAQINFYDTLLTPTPSAGLTGRLAERWTASPDATTYTFHLRKGVKFHSGNEVTAEDVVYTMERMLAINQGYSFVWQGYLMSGSVKALDRYTVQFKLLKPFAPFPSTMAVLFIVDKATVKAHQKPGKFGANGDYGQAWLGSNEAGSGPYTLESDVEGSELRMKRFPGYFRGWHAGAIDEVRVMIVEQEATVVSLAKTGVLGHDQPIPGQYHLRHAQGPRLQNRDLAHHRSVLPQDEHAHSAYRRHPRAAGHCPGLRLQHGAAATVSRGAGQRAAVSRLQRCL